MTRTTLRTILLAVALVAAAVMMLSALLLAPRLNLSERLAGGTHTAVSEKAADPIVPTRLSIPKLGIDTAVEHVGVTSSGNMDTPKDFDNVGWYQHGAQPGAEGKAVIAGHLDDARGNAAVFAHLEELDRGDTITVSDASGRAHTFTVTSRARYPYDDAPLGQVFGPSDVAELILITCDGNWVQRERTYDERLVVYAVLSE